MLRTNRYDPETGTLIYTDEQIAAFEEIRDHYAEFFGVDTTEHGLLPSKITDPDEIEALTAFFAWTAWASAADRPGQDRSEEHTSELQSRGHLVCRLLLEKKKYSSTSVTRYWRL